MSARVAESADGSLWTDVGPDRWSHALPRTALYFADLHNHTLLSDGAGEPAAAFASMRAAGLDVAAVTDHARMGQSLISLPRVGDSRALARVVGLTERSWRALVAEADRANRDGSYVAIHGFEWSSPSMGHINVWFSRRWVDPLHSGAMTESEAMASSSLEALSRLHPATRGFIERLAASATPGRASMRRFYEWLGSSPRRCPDGGGVGALASFNHPGRDGCRFEDFVLDPWNVRRVVAIEVFNRDEDYLFEGTDAGRPSPINQCLNAGWHVGMIGVSDEHEALWGRRPAQGRTGIWARQLSRAGIREALLARRFYATTLPSLRLDMLGNGHRMGSVVPMQRESLRLEIELDPGPSHTGQPLCIQVLGPGQAMPEVLVCLEAPARLRSLVVDVPSGPDRPWMLVRVSDPSLPSDPRARSPFDSFGRAVAYASPFLLRQAG